MFRRLLALVLLSTTLSVNAAPSFQHVAADRIVSVARAELDARLGDERDSAQVSVVGKPEDIVVVTGVLAMKARPLNGRWPRARVSVPVDISVDGQIVRSATVWFSLSVQGKSLSYADDEPVGADAATVKWISGSTDIAQSQSDVLQDAKDVQGMRLRRPVLAGAVALRSDFERVPDVDRKQRVQVSVAYGSVRLQSRGVANGHGNIGDVVSVLVDGAETPVDARITDKGVVEVVQ